jgi:hypothetical protein
MWRICVRAAFADGLTDPAGGHRQRKVVTIVPVMALYGRYSAHFCFAHPGKCDVTNKMRLADCIPTILQDDGCSARKKYE